LKQTTSLPCVVVRTTARRIHHLPPLLPFAFPSQPSNVLCLSLELYSLLGLLSCFSARTPNNITGVLNSVDIPVFSTFLYVIISLCLTICPLLFQLTFFLSVKMDKTECLEFRILQTASRWRFVIKSVHIAVGLKFVHDYCE